MLSKYKLYLFQDLFFNIFIIISYVLIFISALGLSKNAPEYLRKVDEYIRIYICLFLIWRFNPIRHVDKFNDLDRKIAFSAGMFILTTTILNTWLTDIKEVVKIKVNEIKSKFKN
jgi:hypothetical protein